MENEKIRVEVPSSVFERLQRLATSTHRSVEDILATAVNVALPSDPHLPPTIADELAAMIMFSDEKLWAATESSLSSAEQRRLQQLTEASDVRPLSTSESTELERLLV